MSLFGKGFKTKVHASPPCGHLAFHPQADRFLPSFSVHFTSKVVNHDVRSSFINYVVRLTDNKKNITVVTRCAIPVSKTCEQSELGAFTP